MWIISLTVAVFTILARKVVNDAEREYARELLEMMQAVEAEGAKTVNELRNEAITGLAKLLMRG